MRRRVEAFPGSYNMKMYKKTFLSKARITDVGEKQIVHDNKQKEIKRFTSVKKYEKYEKL